MPAAAAEQRERGGAGPGQDRHPRPGRQPHHLAGVRAGLQPGDPRTPLLSLVSPRQVLTINPRSVLASLESIAECGVTTTDPPTLAGGGGGEQGADYPFSDSPGVFLDSAGKQPCRHTSSETSQPPSGSNTHTAAGAETVGKL